MYMNFWYMWTLPVNVRQEKNSGSIKIWFDPSLHRVSFTFLYHLSPTLPKALIHGDFRGGDRLFATYHRIYHLSPPDQSMINKEKRTSLYTTYQFQPLETFSFKAWNKVFPGVKQIVSSLETKCFFKMRKYSANLLKFKQL